MEEVTHSMDTESFVVALCHFISRRGRPEKIRSATKGHKELRKAFQQWNQVQIHEFLLQHDAIDASKVSFMLRVKCDCLGQLAQISVIGFF